jgi:hypothetical protein
MFEIGAEFMRVRRVGPHGTPSESERASR